MRAGLIGMAAMALVFAPLATAEPRSCYRERDFSVASTAGGIEIAGSIMTPLARPRAAVLMITGSGPHTREQRISNSPMFTMIADHLARRGIVVARTDARGFGLSTGPHDDEAYNSADRAEDNRAVLAFLRRQPGFSGLPIGLLGHSEGSMIAAMISAGDPGVAFNVLLSPSTIKGDEVLADQFETGLLQRGASPATAAAVRAQGLRFARFIAGDRSDNTEFARIAHDFLAAHGAPETQNTPEFAQSLLSGYLHSPWSWFFAGYDPQIDLQRVHQPTFAYFGSRDDNLRIEKHAPAFAAAMATAGNHDFSLTVLRDQDHFFLVHDGVRVDQHVPGQMQIAQALYDALDAELARHGWENTGACR